MACGVKSLIIVWRYSFITLEEWDESMKVIDEEFYMKRPVVTKNKFYGHTEWVFTLAIDDANEFLISGSYDCSIRLWSFDYLCEIAVYIMHQGPIWSLKFAPHSTIFASGSADCLSMIWNVE